MKNQDKQAFSLCLFGEEATGEISMDAASDVGVTGEDAVSQEGENPKTREELFEEFIGGEYKDLYEQKVSHIVQKRLKQRQGERERLQQAEEFLGTLSRVYGVEKTDLSALEEAVLGNRTASCNTNALAGSVYQELCNQAQALKELYPSFDLPRELENPKFSALMRIPQVDMQTAFELTHKEEILPAVIAAAGREVEARIAKSLANGSLRPQENGTASQSANLVRTDVSTFSPAQMEDICRRVSRGEKIYL